MLDVDFKRAGASVKKAALKRKEDNGIFFKDHLGELTQEDNIAVKEINRDSLGEGNEYYETVESEYKLTRFTDVTFGREKADSEDDYVKISGVCFYYCDFSMCGFNNVIFSGCSFVGCNFNECYTLGITVVFAECCFSSRTPGKISIDDMPSLFSKCEFSACFRSCDLTHTVLDHCNFYFSRFDFVNMNDAIFSDCSFDTTQFADCDLRNTKIVGPRFIEFRIEDSSGKTAVNRSTFLGPIHYDRKEKREVKYAADVYGIFAELFENAKIMDMSGEYFYLHKVTEFKNLQGAMKVKSFFGLITCGYGERPSFSLLAALFIILLCGTLYMFFGVVYNNELLVFKPFSGEPFPPFGTIVLWYHFSLVTFSTVGYGNVTPIGGSLAVSGAEMVLGVITVGIWVSTLARKMVR